MIEGAGHVLPPLDQDMSHRVHNEIRSQGIGLYLNQMCSGIGKDYVLLGSGERVKADLVILSIGVRPATGFLRDSGIALGRRGEIVVNQYMEASYKDIYALGDAVAVPHVVSGQQVLIPLASPANKQGRIVGDNLCGKRRAYKGSQMFVKTLYDPEGGRILGAQIVGRDGVDKRIDLLANAVRFGQSCYELQEEELSYAPPFSSAKDPVNMVGYVIENILEGKMKPYYLEDMERIPKDAICLDVRTRAEYETGHIPGYINIPLDELRERLDELDGQKEIYLTCQIGLRGYLVQCILEQKGRRTRNLSGGYALYHEMAEDRASGKVR